MQSSIPYYATPLILYHKTIYLSTERCTGIYGNNSGTIIGREVRIFSKLGPLVFVFAMAIRSMPVSANNGLILICGLCCIHAIEPSCLIPLLTVCFSPRRNIAVAFIPVRNAWYPAMRENIVFRLKVIKHRWDNLFVKRCVFRCIGKIIMAYRCHHWIKARQLECSIISLSLLRFMAVSVAVGYF